MDDRILHDPHLELIPDHAGPHYDILRNALTQNGMTVDQAVQALNDSWTQNHDAWIQAWDQQVANDAQALLNQAPLNQDQAPQPEEERAKVEKKKLKMKDFNDTVAVGNYIAPRPAQYALRRLEDFEYVELWYFTPEGCYKFFFVINKCLVRAYYVAYSFLLLYRSATVFFSSSWVIMTLLWLIILTKQLFRNL